MSIPWCLSAGSPVSSLYARSDSHGSSRIRDSGSWHSPVLQQRLYFVSSARARHPWPYFLMLPLSPRINVLFMHFMLPAKIYGSSPRFKEEKGAVPVTSGRYKKAPDCARAGRSQAGSGEQRRARVGGPTARAGYRNWRGQAPPRHCDGHARRRSCKGRKASAIG